MSVEQKLTVTCPQCGEKGEVTAYQTINTELNPEAKTALLNGTLFQYTCPSCGAASMLNYGLLYHDMMHRVLIYSVPENEFEDAKKEIEEAAKTNELAAAAAEKLTRRIVTSPNGLREKASIFDAGLDDRVIELIKLFYGANAVRQYPDIELQDVFFLADKDEFFLEFVADRPLTAKIPREMYNKVAEDFREQLEAAGNAMLTVDHNWAMRVLELAE